MNFERKGYSYSMTHQKQTNMEGGGKISTHFQP